MSNILEGSERKDDLQHLEHLFLRHSKHPFNENSAQKNIQTLLHSASIFV